MRHVTLTCKHHPKLRWSCKSIAYAPGRGYTGERGIFFQGGMGGVSGECECKASELVLAPEDPWAGLTESEQWERIRKDS